MAHTILDDWKVLPRLMMLAVTVLTYQAVHWFMGLPDPSVAQIRACKRLYGRSHRVLWHLDG